MKPTSFRTRRTLAERIYDCPALGMAVAAGVIALIGILGAIGNWLSDLI